MEPLPTIWLKTHFPCCKGPARFLAVLDVPVETYNRRCSKCRQLWLVKRTILGRAMVSSDSHGAAHGAGSRVVQRADKLEWSELRRGRWRGQYTYRKSGNDIPQILPVVP